MYGSTPGDYNHDLIESLIDISPAQEQAVLAIATGSTHAEAADAGGVTRETVTRWLAHHPGVRSALERLRWTLAQEHQSRADALHARAIELVATFLNDEDENLEARIRAALTVLRTISRTEAPRPGSAQQQLAEDYQFTRSMMDRHHPRDMEKLRNRTTLDVLAALSAADIQGD